MNQEIESTLYALWFNRKILNREQNEVDRNVIRETLSFWIEKADKLQIPYWIQNISLLGGENNQSWGYEVLPILRTRFK